MKKLFFLWILLFWACESPEKQVISRQMSLSAKIDSEIWVDLVQAAVIPNRDYFVKNYPYCPKYFPPKLGLSNYFKIQKLKREETAFLLGKYLTAELLTKAFDQEVDNRIYSLIIEQLAKKIKINSTNFYKEQRFDYQYFANYLKELDQSQNSDLALWIWAGLCYEWLEVVL